MKINTRVVFESTPIRHLAVQCPFCDNWFSGYDICVDSVEFEYDLYSTDYICPKCEMGFEGTPNIQECSSTEEVYKDVMKKNVSWATE